MTGHVIKRGVVDNPGNCQVMCYMDPNCVSINFGPSYGEKYECELNNATNEDRLTVHEAFTFLAIEVNILMPELCVSIAAYFFFIQRNWKLPLSNFIPTERREILKPAMLLQLPTRPNPLRKTNKFSFFKQNLCSSSPCLNGGICQVGFTSKGFRCICRTGFPGTNCCPGIASVLYLLQYRSIQLYII